MKARILILFSLVLLPPPTLGASAQATLQKILQLEDQRRSDPEFLSRALMHPSDRVKKAALFAIGRIGDPTPLDAVVRIVSSRRNPSMRSLAAFSLSLLEDPVSPKILSQNLAMHSDTATQGAILTAIGRSGEAEAVKILASRLEANSPSRLVADIAEGLGMLWSKDSVQWPVPSKILSHLARFAKGKGDSAEFSAFALSRFKGAASFLPAEPILQAAQNARSLDVKAYLFKVLRNLSGPVTKKVLRDGLMSASSQGLRVEAAKSLGNQPWDAGSKSALLKGMGDRSSSVTVESIQAIRKLKAKDEGVRTALISLWRNHRSQWVKGEALRTLALLHPKKVGPLIQEALENPALPSSLPAISVLGILGEDNHVKILTGILKNPKISILLRSTAVQSVMQLKPGKITPELKAALGALFQLADPGITTLVAQLAAYYGWKDFAEKLKEVYPNLSTPEHLEAKIAVLTAIAQIGDASYIPMVKSALSDPDKLVVEAAVATLSTLGAGDFKSKIPLNSKVSRPTPPLAEVQKATGRLVVVKTTRGEIQMRLLKEAPLTAHNFLTLAKRGFYNQTTFHRVVPNFVAQGGDPRGDGYGGPGYFIRDEISPVKHLRGTVGLATAGKDTGGSQFFINLSANHHLNRRYTVFAKVISGITVADRLEQGDRILSVQVR